MNLRDALYNWLQMKIVADARPEDQAAAETRLFFETILTEDHKLTEFSVGETTDRYYTVRFELEGRVAVEKFDRELADQLLGDIESNPKYNE